MAHMSDGQEMRLHGAWRCSEEWLAGDLLGKVGWWRESIAAGSCEDKNAAASKQLNPLSIVLFSLT